MNISFRPSSSRKQPAQFTRTRRREREKEGEEREGEEREGEEREGEEREGEEGRDGGEGEGE